MDYTMMNDGPTCCRFVKAQNILLCDPQENSYRFTPFIVTFCDTALTAFEIQNFIESGLRIVRFNMNHVTKQAKLKLLTLLKQAIKQCCEKYEIATWPIAVCFDLPNACIRTGHLEFQHHVRYKENSIVEVTADNEFKHKCNAHTIFIDDPYTIAIVNPGTEIGFKFGVVVMVCTERINPKTIKCRVTTEGELGNVEFVCIRGVKYMRPALTRKDKELIDLAKQLNVDLITVNNVRFPETLKKVKDYFNDVGHMPLLLSSICDQQGLDNIDAIIEKSDGIILAREFLDNSIVNKNHMPALQLLVSAKCMKQRKPFFISGNILEQTLLKGTLSGCDLSDITNAVLQGAGFLLRNYHQASNVVKTLHILDSVCITTEPLTKVTHDFWRMHLEFQLPVNAAEASVLSCSLLAKASESRVVVLPTVSGKTAKQLAHITPDTIILTVSTSPEIARKLRLYRGIVPLIYDKKSKHNWHDEMEARIQFAVSFGIKHNLLRYGNTYVALKKTTPTSAYCDSVSIWKVVTAEARRASLSAVVCRRI